MKRFLTAVVATFFLLTVVAHADSWKSAVIYYEGSEKDILDNVKSYENFFRENFKIRGTHYYTGNDGFRYRESYFGNNDKNRLIFRLKDNGAVWAAWIIVPENATYQDSTIGDSLFSMIMWEIGLSNNELDKLIVDMRNAVDKYKKQKISDATQTFSVWCAKTRRYIDVEARYIKGVSVNAHSNCFISARAKY